MAAPVVADPDMRADAVRRLVAQAERDGEVALTPLGGMDLCTLGGPRHAVLPKSLMDAWLNMRPGERDEFISHSTGRLVREGVLIPDPGNGVRHGYKMSPELGIILAARCRPAFVVVAQTSGTLLPSLSLFAFGDQDQPVRAFLSEILFKIPGADGKRRISSARLLTCVYVYHLVTLDRAASHLTDWAITPTGEQRGWRKGTVRTLTRIQPDEEQQKFAYRLTMPSNDTTVHITGLDKDDRQAERSCDRRELETIMTQLLNGDIT